MPEGLAGLAVEALLEELSLHPKPGLVSPVDNGSHTDMDAALLRASALSLRPAFTELAKAGAAPFATLAAIGLRAEHDMMAATAGINTHRGAIFALGLLVAATAAAGGPGSDPTRIRACLLENWGVALRAHCAGTPPGGPRTQAASGFPAVFETGLPHFAALQESGIPREAAAIEVLFVLIAQLGDTNLLRRGGQAGRDFARTQAADFLQAGGVRRAGWREAALSTHHAFVARRLSPGGAADMLAATLFLHSLTRNELG